MHHFSDIDVNIGNISTQFQLISDQLQPNQLFEFIRLIGAYIFDNCGFRRLELNIVRTNEEAIDIAQQLGFETDAVLRQAKLLENKKSVDVVCLSMLDVEWRKMRGKFGETMKNLLDFYK